MTVSRLHAQLERTADGWLLSDLESTNGTRVNGWRVRGKVPVRAGDLVSFGNLEVVFVPRATSYRPRASGRQPRETFRPGFARVLRRDNGSARTPWPDRDDGAAADWLDAGRRP